MTHDPSHAPEAAVAPAAHATGAHDPDGDELGPIDWANWAAGALAVAIALAITACFVVATQGLGAF